MADLAVRPWLPWFRRHERLLAVLWLAGTALVVLAVAARPIRERLLYRVGLALDRREDRWEERLARGQALLDAGNFASATSFLERLDAEHPARNVRHGRDKERELLLRLLARSYEGQGRPGRAMATWERLVAFDSLNYLNRFAYARAAERLLSGWALAEEAKDGFAGVLRIFPAHLPSLRGYVDYYMDRGEFIPITTAYRTYLDAFFIHPVTLRLGDATADAKVAVDGRAHELEFAVVLPPGRGAELSLGTRGFAFQLEAVTLEPARVVGRVAAAVPVTLEPARFAGRNATAASTGWLPADTTGAVSIQVPPDAQGVSRVRVRLRLFKPLDRELWGLIRKSYRNLLDEAGLAAVAERSLPFDGVERADRAITDLPWAREGVEAFLRDEL
jgi:tetratricopeptide (TPR) repeat protein